MNFERGGYTRKTKNSYNRPYVPSEHNKRYGLPYYFALY
jgi:hypothetical protein